MSDNVASTTGNPMLDQAAQLQAKMYGQQVAYETIKKPFDQALEAFKGIRA